MGTPMAADLNSMWWLTNTNQQWQRRSLLCLLLLLLFFSPLHSSSSQIPYSPHCGHIVPETTRLEPYSPRNHPPLRLFNAYVSDAHQLLGTPTSQISADFRPYRVFATLTPEILGIDGTLRFKVSSIRNFPGRGLYRVYGVPRPFRLLFRLSGSWSSSSGDLCMVGSGQLYGKNSTYNVVFKLNYQNHSTISTSLVSGRLESLDSEGSDRYFRPISLLDFSHMNYDYSLIKQEIGANYPVVKSAATKQIANQDCFNLISASNKFELYCDGSNCTLPDLPFLSSPNTTAMSKIDCSNDPFVRFSFVFSNSSSFRNGILQPFDPLNTLVAEGVWNENRNQIRFVACRILMSSLENASIGDCSFRLNFTLASVLSIRSRSLVDGQMRSNKTVSDVGYFKPIEIRTSELQRLTLPGMRYEYTEIDRANRYCSENKAKKHKGKNYPDPYSSFDMKFDMEVRNDKNQAARGSAIPLFVDGLSEDDRLVWNQLTRPPRLPTIKHLGTLTHGSRINRTHGGLVNISYSLTFKPMLEFKAGGKSFLEKRIDISAEGPYDTETGLLCMVGCWGRDCEVFIRVQFPHGMNGVAKGTIESKRQTTDPLYFEQMSLTATSITGRQAANTIWRMDFEIAMVLVSNSLACIFLGLQLLHVKNRPQVLPFISVVMLVVLTLGHMVPLLLNFDALLTNRNRWNVPFGSGDWLEINEIIVRAITMIAFLLEARLLQLTWSSRTGNENRSVLWSTEKKVVYLSLPLCAFAALVAWFLHPWKSLQFMRLRYKRISRWSGLKEFPGLVLDAFLFPQIVFNVFCDSKENSLAPSYYVGTTAVRLLPHAYDLFRAHGSALKLDMWYIYANPRMNFYSTSWDIIICCCGVLFAVVIYLQQRFGGRWVVPSRLRESYEFEKVPVAIADDIKL